MLGNFDAGLRFVWQFDGLRKDSAPGEAFATSYGVTQMTWDEARARGIVHGPIESGTPDIFRTVLKSLYWDKIEGDALPAGCDVAVFNSAVVAGVYHAARLAQRVAGVDPDGDIGPLTVLAIRGMHPRPFIEAFTEGDEAFFSGLAKAPLFLRGWDRRATECEALALSMVAP